MALATNDLKVISQLTHAVGKFSSETSPDGVCRMGVSAWLSRLELALQSYFQADLNFVDYGRLWRIVFHLLDERAQVFISNQGAYQWHEFKEALVHRFGLTPRQVKQAIWACRQKPGESIVAYFDRLDSLRAQQPSVSDEELLEVVRQNAAEGFREQLATAEAFSAGQ